ncbi:hypothetical protein [Burkholderia contaminans]|uniref:hypothetical protein n=1 Tax=Burkholderia contaminans TaxID=488447 RepID=UPI0013CEE854|nr:hypothetical protein [Burkholderia contaminans]
MAWSQKLAPYDLVPIFPPRTNVEPGDLYLVCKDPKNPGKPSERFAPIFLTALDGFHEQITEFFKQRWILPTEKSPSTETTIAIPETARGIKTPTQWTHLALVSFPEIFQVEGSTTSGGVSAPTGFSILGLGGERKKLQTYVLSMPAAEWAGLPWIQAQEQADIALAKLKERQREKIATLYDNLDRKYKSACGAVSVAVVQEVYYTRHMTLSFGTDKSAAINAQARLYVNPNQARYNVQQAASQTAVANPPAAASDSTDTHVNAANKDLVAAQTAANAAVNLGLPGAVFTSATVANDGLSFDYHFAAPVAVGAKLLDIAIDHAKTDEAGSNSATVLSDSNASDNGSAPAQKVHRAPTSNAQRAKGSQRSHTGTTMHVGIGGPFHSPTTPLSEQHPIPDLIEAPQPHN